MTEVDFETDTFLSLLTEALRSGPGSPTWHEALRILRAGGIEHADEYQLLVTAREHLESGRDYRSIRAGPGFTQRLMARLESDAENLAVSSPITTTVAIASAGIMLLVLASIGYLLWNASDRSNDSPTLFTRSVTEWTKTLADDWQKIGALNLDSQRGGMLLAPAIDPSPAGAGAYWRQPIDPNEPFAVVCLLRIYHFEDNVITQIFVSDQPEFADANGITPHEFVWLLKGSQAQVISPDQRIESQAEVVPIPPGTAQVRITIDHTQAYVAINNKRTWAGPVAPDPLKPRYVGIRFLRQAKTDAEGVVVQSMHVDLRQK